MQLLRRNGAITLYFKVNIFRLSRQLEPGKVCGYVQIVDIAEYLSRFKLVLNLLQFLPVYRRPLQLFQFFTDGSFRLQAGDKLYVTGSPKDLSSYLRTLGRDLPGIHSAFLIGGSRIAHYLSKMLLSMGVRVTLVESNEAHCRRLSESLPEALILHGDGTDQELLLSEHFTNNDAFIALTGRDEDNLISALYAQQQGLRKVVAKCNRVNYSSVVQAAGLDCVVAPKLITVARILRLVRGFEDKSGSVMTALYRISDTDVEAAEFILHENTPHLGIPLKDLEIRKGFLIVALLHENQVVVPSGGTVLSPGDRVIVISHGQGIQTFRDIFLKP